jgi:DNA-binding NtrC family response regulator
MQLSILIVDDDPQGLQATVKILERSGAQVFAANSGREALQIVSCEAIDLVITDLRMPEMTGIELVRELKKLHPELPFLVMTAFGRVDEAVWLMKVGAVDFLEKPFSKDQLLDAVKKVRPNRPQSSVNQYWLGPSVVSKKLDTEIGQVSRSEATVLLQGESGTGKDVVAKEIHQRSSRRGASFVAINCAAIPESLLEAELFGVEKGAYTGASARAGLFESATGGTLFLDEIGELPLGLQPKILRALEDRRARRLGSNAEYSFDVRLIAATNRNLKNMVQENAFRSDLYFRLDVLGIGLPPLRERMEDLLPFVNEFLRHRASGQALGDLSPSVEKALMAYSWPGNWREVKNALERALALSSEGEIHVEHLPQVTGVLNSTAASVKIPLGSSLRAAESILFEEALARADGDRAKAAAYLGVHERTIYRWLKQKAQSGEWSNEPIDLD